MRLAIGTQGCQGPAGCSGWRGPAWVGSVEGRAGDRKEKENHLGWEIQGFLGKASVEGLKKCTISFRIYFGACLITAQFPKRCLLMCGGRDSFRRRAKASCLWGLRSGLSGAGGRSRAAPPTLPFTAPLPPRVGAPHPLEA